MKKNKYSAERIRQILITAYPSKTGEEIEEMVKETVAQYKAEAKQRGGGSSDKKSR